MEPGKEHDQVVDYQSLVCEECWSNIFNNDAICAFWQRESREFKYTGDFLHVLRASKDGCQWCQAFLSIIGVSSLEDWHEKERQFKGRDAERTTIFSVRMKWERITTPGSQPSDECMLFVGNSRYRNDIVWYTYEPKNPVAAIETKRPRPDLSSDEVFEQAKFWIETCKRHSNCLQQRDGPLPKIVIQVASPEGPIPCRLVEPRDLLGQYIALSYCWGKQYYVLTAENKKDLMIRLDENRLPQTILDAIYTTRQLGYQFLWIDALCIVQNSATEKAEDIANMNKTYQGAALTIVAGSASSASEGFLHPKRPISQMLIDVQRNPNKEFKIPCKCAEDEYITVGVKEMEPSSSFMDPIVRRAWTFQETLLSPRLLSYSCHTLTWHCKAASINLDDWYYPDRDSYESLAQDITVSRGHREVSLNWNTVVKLYTDRALTVSEDKLPALAALATAFSPVLGPTYLAGIWEGALPEALLWMPQSEYPDAELRSFACGDLERVVRRPKTYRAPTWSWASLDGLITYGHDDLEGRDICEVVEFKTIPKYSIVPFGEVISGHIRVRGCMRQLYLRPRNGPRNLVVFWSDCELSTNGRNIPEPQSANSGTIVIDVYEDLHEKTIQCLPISRIIGGPVSGSIRGLVLVMDEGNMYRRIGIFDGSEKDFEGIEEEIITII
jgi:hypothetical protein